LLKAIEQNLVLRTAYGQVQVEFIISSSGFARPKNGWQEVRVVFWLPFDRIYYLLSKSEKRFGPSKSFTVAGLWRNRTALTQNAHLSFILQI